MDGNENIEITDSLLMGYINEELDARTKAVVSSWRTASNANEARYSVLLKAWNAAGKVDPKPVVVDTEAAWKNVLGQIKEEKGSVIPIQTNYKRRIYLSIAASVVVLFGVLAWLKFDGVEEMEYVTIESPESGFVDALSDGSTVTFNANTSLVYPLKFANNERRVTLNGEAFFEIERNEEKPFIIDLPQDAYVKVLGTSFNIKAQEGDSLTEVFVSTGKVEFGAGESTLILTAGQKGIYNRNSGVLVRDESATAGLEEMFWKDEKVRFNEVPLHEAIRIMNAITNEEILLDCPEIENQSIVSSYTKENSVVDFLEFLINSYPLEYSKSAEGVYRIECDDL